MISSKNPEIFGVMSDKNFCCYFVSNKFKNS